MNTKVISVSNNKGGSGKTTVTCNLGYALSQMGKKTLLIDADMQINLTRSYDFEKNQEKSLYEAIYNQGDIRDYIQNTQYENLDIVISDYMLSAIDMFLINSPHKETIFKRVIEPVIQDNTYDYIIIDTCPFLGLLNYNILVSSDYVLIPVELSAFGIEGLEPLNNFINEVKIYNPALEILGIVETKIDNRESTTEDTRALLRELFGDIILKSSIPIDINVKKSQFVGKPLKEFMSNSRGALAYENLAMEVDSIVQ